MALKTPLYENHLGCDAKIIDFNGWLMPIHYGSQLEEHHIVREKVGMFDVSHMMVTSIEGAGAFQFLQYLLANDVGKLKHSGQALYSLMLNEQGGVIDDLIVYREAHGYRVVSNAGTREKVTEWLIHQSEAFDAMCIVKDEGVMIAVQGPQWLEYLSQVVEQPCVEQLKSLKKFHGFAWEQMFIAKTGYTGEPGVEVMLPAVEGKAFWDRLVEVGVQPCGLGARDTLRLEAGLNLYGSDMDETTLPGASNLSWTVSIEQDDPRDFVGKAALVGQSVETALVGLVVQGRVIPRSGQEIRGEAQGGECNAGTSNGGGVITSGSFSPTLGMGIALARVSRPVQAHYAVQIRNKWVRSTVVDLPFVRDGKKAFAVRS